MALTFTLGGCNDNSQSVLIPAGLEARQIASFAWLLFGFVAFVFMIVIAALVAAIYGPGPVRRALASRRAIIGLGLVFPAATLLILFVISAWSTRGLLAGTSDAATIQVTGEQWWWRVRYTTGAGTTFESANEIRIPVGQAVVFELNSADVIHSFWIPALGGKIDMIPGRTNRLRLTAERTGIYRGQCAEYCGGPHALMAFKVIVAEPQEHADWIAQQSRPAETHASGIERDGAALFMAAGCGACHAIDGTAAQGRIGPNLTGLGGRISVGIDENPVSHDNIVRFLGENQTIKPHNRMPEFKFLRAEERDAIASYLLGLR
jgi:cytochrome c oxidase subunit 2